MAVFGCAAASLSSSSSAYGTNLPRFRGRGTRGCTAARDHDTPGMGVGIRCGNVLDGLASQLAFIQSAFGSKLPSIAGECLLCATEFIVTKHRVWRSPISGEKRELSRRRLDNFGNPARPSRFRMAQRRQVLFWRTHCRVQDNIMNRPNAARRCRPRTVYSCTVAGFLPYAPTGCFRSETRLHSRVCRPRPACLWDVSPASLRSASAT